MAADFSSASLFHRSSAVIMDDTLVLLDNDGRARDRMRKVLFERVENFLVWKKLPWIRMLLFFVLLAPPSVWLVSLGGKAVMLGSWSLSLGGATTVFGSVLLGLLLLIEGRYLYCRKTYFRITWDGQEKTFTKIVRPKKIKALTERLQTNIRTTQKRLIANAERQAEERRDSERARYAPTPSTELKAPREI